jgi:hypothetical protein
MMITQPVDSIRHRPRFARASLRLGAIVLACGVGVCASTSAADDPRAPTLQGFTTDLSVGRGQTVHFKIETDASAYSITIYQVDDAGVAGAQPVGGVPNPQAPQVQPPCLGSQDTGLVDCGNWSESASWTVPASTAPGIYVALLQRADTQASSQIVFVVQDDGP